jgi:ATP-dependent DNA helicase RecG
VLKEPVRFVKGVGEVRARALARLGINTIGDLLRHFPRRYEDRSTISRICDLKVDQPATVIAAVRGVTSSGYFHRTRFVKLKIEDETGVAEAIWFNQPYLAEKFRRGQTLILSGKVKAYKTLQLVSPAYEIISERAADKFNAEELSAEFGRILPIYRLTDGISHKRFRSIVRESLKRCQRRLAEFISHHILSRRRLPSLESAFGSIHFPENMEGKDWALCRFKYEELFLLQTVLALRKRRLLQEKSFALAVDEKIDSRIRGLFPFKFTGAQEKVIREIVSDLTSGRPTNRLLQGDVGSGKTAVAVYALLVAVANKYQAAFMAPTEVLAEQHFRTLQAYLSKSRVRIISLTSSTQSVRQANLTAIARGEVDIAVGTHALIEKDVVFKRLGLIVVDEQHKFGVIQRFSLVRKGLVPHVLVMTATPIPRTLAMTVFGDLDTSIIDELPPGRRPVKTNFIKKENAAKAYDFIRAELLQGRQAYFVYPVIEDSLESDLKGAVRMYAHLKKQVFPEFAVGLVHGRMKPEEKEKAMAEFISGKTKILVSTVLIEVGIDVPNATVMVVEHCERFGLAQLHQLRGRIGRGGKQSYCFLFGNPHTDEAKARVRAFLSTTDGFKIAEEDLRIRGPGEFLGTKQSGLPDLKVADLSADYELLRFARADAFETVRKDPNLTLPENSNLRRTLKEKFGARLPLIGIA